MTSAGILNPQQLDTVDIGEAEALLFDPSRIDDLPPFQDTVLGDAGAAVGVLLIHGFSGSNRELLYLGNHLARSGYRVMIPLLPGHGSNADELAKTSSKDWLEKSAAAYRYLAEEIDDRAIIVAGHSLGGALAIQIAQWYNPDGLVLLATPIRYPLHLRIGISILSILGVKLPYDQFHFNETKLYSHPAVKYIEDNYSPVHAKSINDVFKLLGKAYTSLEKLDLPIKLIYSKNDKTVPVKQVKLITKKLAIEPEITWLQHSDHVIVIDAERDTVQTEVLGFVAKTTGQ